MPEELAAPFSSARRRRLRAAEDPRPEATVTLARPVDSEGMRTSRTVFPMLMLLIALTTPARAFDLTGHWVGKASCKGLADGQTFARKTDVVADVSESGRDVNFEFQGFALLSGASGIAVPSAKNADKGEVGFVSCGTEPVPIFGVTGSGKVATKPSKGTGSIKFVAVVAGKDLGGLGVTDGVFTCTFGLKRVSTTTPAVGGCVM